MRKAKQHLVHCHRILESCRLDRFLRSSPRINLTLPNPPTKHIPKCHTYLPACPGFGCSVCILHFSSFGSSVLTILHRICILHISSFSGNQPEKIQYRSVHTRRNRWLLSVSSCDPWWQWGAFLVQNPGFAEISGSLPLTPSGDRISPLNVY